MMRKGINPTVLLIAYVFLSLLPLGLGALRGLSMRPWRDELATGLALVGFSMLLLEFVLSGRFQWVSGRVGIDVTMRFHQLIGRIVAVFIIVHPFLYSLPMSGPLPWDPTGLTTLNLSGMALATGAVAWLLLPTLVVISIFRRETEFSYETWRLIHGIGAASIALLSLLHALDTGRYSADPLLAGFWLFLTAAALATLLHVYLIRPWLLKRQPYRVTSVERIASKSWELVIEPENGQAIDFKPGQFVWLTVGHSPFSLVEHPFSIASCPTDRPRVEFMIKEAGDFTDRIGSIPVGTRAYIDGPHGALFVPEGHSAGITFIAGGVGLAPIMSMLRQLRADRDERPLRLVYGNRVEGQIMYRSELDDMEKELNLRITHVVSEPPEGWQGETGMVHEALIHSLMDADDCNERLYVVCGPPAMIDEIAAVLHRLDVPRTRILDEKFSYD